MAEQTKYVYDFSEGSREMRDLLGGKGANLAEMTQVLGEERVPAGFTVSTEACVAYMDAGGEKPPGLDDQVDEALERLERLAGRSLGDAEDPLLVSVRSGARVSMPGMLDTVLNLGLNDRSVVGLAERTGNERFARDSYRRLVQMFGNVVRGIPGDRYEDAIAEVKRERGVELDTDLDVDDLKRLTDRFREIFREETGDQFPEDPRAQLDAAIQAVFGSWKGRRAVEYRRLNGIPERWGTAVNVQQMVFGNRGEDSGSGVAFTRDEITGAPEPSGDFLVNAQGEDVVSGVRNTQGLDEMAELLPEAHRELIDALRTLERHFADMQDVEFTVEQGRLYLLQTRNAKRPAQAAVRFVVDAVAEGLLEPGPALLTIDAAKLDALLHPTFDPAREYDVIARGVAASPGAAKGAIVFTAAEAVERGGAGDDVILVRPFTEAEDVAGFAAARGILTSEGGKASHAALVARGMGRPCVCGASDLDIDLGRGVVSVNGHELRGGQAIAIDGSTGAITLDDVPLVTPGITEEFRTVLGWADELRRLEVRANADAPADAARARSFGAEGIGLCRTEHMFFGPDRDRLVKDMFVAAEEWRRAHVGEGRLVVGSDAPPTPVDDRFRTALGALQDLQRADFEGIFKEMTGLPVTIRLLDPPLHEFLPVEHFEQELEELESKGAAEEEIERARQRLALVHDLHEANPMLGTRGSRLAILYPPIYEMQVRAIIEAAAAAGAGGEKPHVEIMLPLIAYETELEHVREILVKAATAAQEEVGHEVPYSVGTMLELPRACLIAERVARHADFFSFGTNDLTQTTIGLSRDDVEGRFIGAYLKQGILDQSPFETIDEPGVGELVRIGVARGREGNPDIHLGICGEHGGDPQSVAFFHRSGLDYVSCSPYRVPIARVAAAQAAAAENIEG
ncbi:MAG TPA: pyruvate, phosphate dikinase [Solirubrobacterales bacterium]|nr:pyruvate, phosphate dikinase [Solirubrobacterales bacterium]